MGIPREKNRWGFFVCKKALIGLYIENKVQYVVDCKS